LSIFEEIRAGFVHPDTVAFVAGRGVAIAQAIAVAGVDDVVVLAGKGHEDYQEIHGQRMPFSDLNEADLALATWEADHA
jgi:UDP-N-acetylmuramoyl-L-alanyl-D-glutamate--2,6-diaminopimelate ligase